MDHSLFSAKKLQESSVHHGAPRVESKHNSAMSSTCQRALCGLLFGGYRLNGSKNGHRDFGVTLDTYLLLINETTVFKTKHQVKRCSHAPLSSSSSSSSSCGLNPRSWANESAGMQGKGRKTVESPLKQGRSSCSETAQNLPHTQPQNHGQIRITWRVPLFPLQYFGYPSHPLLNYLTAI